MGVVFMGLQFIQCKNTTNSTILVTATTNLLRLDTQRQSHSNKIFRAT